MNNDELWAEISNLNWQLKQEREARLELEKRVENLEKENA